MLAILLVLLVLVVNLVILWIGLRVILQLPQVANSPTGVIFFTSDHWAIRFARNLLFCQPFYAPVAEKVVIDTTNTSPNVIETPSGNDFSTQNIADALKSTGKHSVAKQDKHANAVKQPASSNSHSSNTNATLINSNTGSVSKPSEAVVVDIPVERTVTRVDLSYDDDSMLSRDPVFAGMGFARRQPTESLEQLLFTAGKK